MFFVARVGLLSLLFASVDAEDWSSLRARADRLCQAGNYQAALKTYKIAFAEVDPADAPRLATTLSDLGRTHRLLGDYREAKSAFARALRIFETDASTPVLQLAIACNNLAVLEMTLGRYSSAQHLYDRALQMYERAPATAAELSDIFNNIGTQYHRRGLYREAEHYFRRALEHAPEGSTAAAAYLTNYGSSALERGETAEARRSLNTALAINTHALGPTHPNTAKTLYYLAVCAQRQHDFDAAREFYERVIAIETTILSPDNQDPGICYANYAIVLRNLHRNAEAQAAEQHAAAALKKARVNGRSTVDVLSLMPLKENNPQ